MFLISASLVDKQNAHSWREENRLSPQEHGSQAAEGLRAIPRMRGVLRGLLRLLLGATSSGEVFT